LNIEQVLSKKFVGKRWHIIESDYETLQWDDESPKPTLAELEALIPIIEAEIAAEQEARNIAIAEKQVQREALLTRLGITKDEAKLLGF
jgi:hypothetical protein